MRYVLTKIEECFSASDVVKSITLLQAIRGVAEAWKSVNSSVIKKCFRKAGILDKDFNVIKEFVFVSYPFDDIDSADVTDPELLELMKQTNGDNHCSQDSYISDDLATCLEMDNDNWEEDFFAELGPSSKQTHTDSNDEESDDDVQGDDPPPLKIKSYTEALIALEDVSLFLQNRGHMSEATKIMECSSNITSLCCHCLSTSRQTTL